MQHPIETVVLALSSGQHEERRRIEYQGDHPISLIETEGKPQKVVRTLARCLTSWVPSASTTSQLCSYPSGKRGTYEALQSPLPGLLPTPADPSCSGGAAYGVCSHALQCSASVHCKQQCSHLLGCHHVSNGQLDIIIPHRVCWAQLTSCHGNFPDKKRKKQEENRKQNFSCGNRIFLILPDMTIKIRSLVTSVAQFYCELAEPTSLFS